MEKARLEYLYQLCLDNRTTPEERLEMEELLVRPENEEVAKRLLLEAYEAQKKTVDISDDAGKAILEAIYKAGREKVFRRRVLFRGRYRMWPAAAVFVLAFSFGLYLVLSTRRPQAQATAKQDIAPGSNKAVLTLADGSTIILDEKADGQLAVQSGIKVTKAADGRLVYEVSGKRPEPGEALPYNILKTPKGGQYEVVLPDGTHVWLNAASSLKFPAAFEDPERAVELNGEAYFEVASLLKTGGSPSKKEKVPFIVRTSSATGVRRNQMVEVLGTHFNINAYDDEGAVKTTLLEGSVRVDAVAGDPRTGWHAAGNPKLLLPGQQSSYSGGNITVTVVDPEDIVDWKNGMFRFNDEELGSIMRKIARWYNVDVEFADEDLRSEPFVGIITRFSKVSSVLRMLEVAGGVHFKVNGDKILVSRPDK